MQVLLRTLRWLLPLLLALVGAAASLRGGFGTNTAFALVGGATLGSLLYFLLFAVALLCGDVVAQRSAAAHSNDSDDLAVEKAIDLEVERRLADEEG